GLGRKRFVDPHGVDRKETGAVDRFIVPFCGYGITDQERGEQTGIVDSRFNHYTVGAVGVGAEGISRAGRRTLGRGSCQTGHRGKVPGDGTWNTDRIAAGKGDDVVVRIESKARVSAAVWAADAAEALLNGVAAGRVVEPDHDPGGGAAGSTIHPEVAIRVADIGDDSGGYFLPFFDQDVGSDDITGVRMHP